jgi:hypothetical protein
MEASPQEQDATGRPCPTFARLVAPHEPGVFVESHWDRHAVLIRGSEARSHLLPRFDTAALMAAASRAPAGALAASRRDEAGNLSGIAISHGQAEFCFRAGMTINLQSAQRLDPELAATSAALKRELEWPGEVEAYVFWSPPGGGLPLHFDDSAGFVVQLLGEKRWCYSSEPGVGFPPAPVTAKRAGDFRALYPWSTLQVPALEAMCDVVLRPGDVLYTPAGTWHTAAASPPEGSLAVTFAFSARPLFKSVGAGFERLFMSSAAWRASPLPPVDGRISRTALRAREARLSELKRRVAQLSLEEFERICGFAPDRSQPSADPGDAGERGLEPEDLMQATAPLGFSAAKDARGQDCFLVRAGERSANVGIDALALLQALCEVRGAFPAKAAMAWSGAASDDAWQRVRAFLQALLIRGIVQRA